MRSSSGDQDMPEVDLDSHRALIDAVESGDPDAAEAACRLLLAEPMAAVGRLLGDN
jgi:DNA-binding GntR family transcriptional regulator